MSVALVSLCARADARALHLPTCHPSHPSLPDHPFLVALCLRVVRRLATTMLATTVLVTTILVTTILVTILVTILGICLFRCPGRRGRALLSGCRLGDYGAISITLIRNERYKATILVGTTNAFDAVGELDAQGLFTFVRRILGDMSKYEDK
jgi:hypothetical protein